MILTSMPWLRLRGALRFATRDTNPELVAAAKALFGYPYNDLSPEHAKWLVQKKAELKKAQGNAYFSNMLDKLNIEQGVANRAMMADYLDAKRFRGYSSRIRSCGRLTTSGDGRAIPTRRSTFRSGKDAASLDAARKRGQSFPQISAAICFVAKPRRQQKKGGIAMKFEVAYFRPTKFGDPTGTGRGHLSRYRRGSSHREGVPYVSGLHFPLPDSRRRTVHLPVHIHTAVGIGDYFNLSESNMMNLESILRDPRYASTTFVLIHGGYPLEREAIWLAAMKNVYLDSSLMEIGMYPSEFKHVLKQWLETFPDKITFGTDSFPVQRDAGRGRELLAGGAVLAHGSGGGAGGDDFRWGGSESPGAEVGPRLSARHGSGNLCRERCSEMARK